MISAVQTELVIDRYALPVDPAALAAENIFQVRHILRGLNLSDEQIEVCEVAVELARRGEYPAAIRRERR